MPLNSRLLTWLIASLASSPLLAQGAATKPADDTRKQIDELQKEVDQLRKDVTALRVKTAGAIEMEALRDRVRARVPKFRVFQQTPAPMPVPGVGTPGGAPPGIMTRPAPGDTDAPVRSGATGAVPPGPGQTGGRLLGDAEKSKLPKDTVFTVDGSPVSRQELEETIAYLRSYAQGRSDADIKQRAMAELIRVHAVEQAFAANLPALKQRILDARKKVVDQKQDFAAVAKEMSDCPTREHGGDLGFLAREGAYLPFARAAFEAAGNLGAIVGPITTQAGYHLIRITGSTPGADRASDTVRASHILVMFDKDQGACNAVAARADAGRCDLGFVDASLRESAPEVFRK